MLLHSQVLRYLWYFLFVYALFIVAMFLGVCLMPGAPCTTGPFFDATSGCFVVFNTQVCSVALFWLFAVALFFVGVGVGLGAVLLEAAFAATATYKEHSIERIYATSRWTAMGTLLATVFIIGLLYFFYITVALTNVIFFVFASMGAFLAVAGGVAPMFLYDVRMAPVAAEEDDGVACTIVINGQAFEARITRKLTKEA